MQKIREQVLIRRDKVYQDNEGEVRKRWHFEDAVSFVLFLLDFVLLVLFPPSHSFIVTLETITKESLIPEF